MSDFNIKKFAANMSPTTKAWLITYIVISIPSVVGFATAEEVSDARVVASLSVALAAAVVLFLFHKTYKRSV